MKLGDVKHRVQLPTLLNDMNLNGLGVEIGVKKGIYSYHLLQNSELKMLFSVDPWENQISYIYNDISNPGQPKYDQYYIETVKRLMYFGKRSVILKMFSEDAVNLFKDRSLDFVYIDANHSYKACKKDIEIWWPKVKIGGIFAGHDYLDGKLPEGDFGVKSAVDEFIINKRIYFYITKEKWPSWYIQKLRKEELLKFEEYLEFIRFISPFIVNKKVRNEKKGVDAMVEMVSGDYTYIVLDETFGLSTIGEKDHIEWVKNHGNDGRYSLPIKEFFEDCYFIQN